MAKIRTGFVSNSSSSSFICEVCGESTSGMDMSLEEAEMCECENGHTFCTVHFLTDWDDHIEKKLKENEDFEEYDYRWEVEPEFCPICAFQVLEDNVALKYLLKQNGITNNELLKEFKFRFQSYTELLNYVKTS